MVTRKQQTQAEAAEAVWHARGRQAFRNRKPLLTMLHLSPGAMLVDGPLGEAVEKGLLVGDLPALRQSLIGAAILAESMAHATLLVQAASKHHVRRQQMAAQIANSLRLLLTEVDLEARDTDRAAEKEPDAGFDATNLHAILGHGQALTSLLTAYASHTDAEMADATKVDVREFFRIFAAWWGDRIVDPEQRGAKAIRNRLAAAVWLDFDREISAGYTPEAWAKDKFRELEKNRKNP